ncbi:MAG: hypothetical protein B7Z60_03415 [Ferrovum sp. 37-45-19]|uniref:BPSL1445 family SYLF domain-containing lipoprotein n=1 Tax=Ferrovum sp. JA12 TaxID=1356299 RepID=UPI000703A52A|nr:YSC84-related protein [Ferrovum sp. JA12]OYV80541.1 MAG: hypothetical protein B7Z65_01485 [Ferrovum sp. 21-44-67]OYV94856.1 MAG: hypothetical protein B7Z60_03415 [Ferrovum sp. 37-45-19]OZB34111.1 MAG: hypothetical protein B7X47_01755 [Ferrovum sp. 34-44-207]HQT81011.1 YSC84-related protein [Ferrovaceae bacterium]KRH79264.1 hypothetical protein FERRO_03270 [Ferrovum sp. JA12]
MTSTFFLRPVSRFFLVCCLLFAFTAHAESKQEIDAEVKETVQHFAQYSSAGLDLMHQSQGYLVFPNIVKAGMGIGGSYGEGVLIVGGKTVGYYNIASASFGFQLGVESHSAVILFMKQSALSHFRNSPGWQAGVDGSVALATLGAAGKINTQTLNQPIIGFIFSNKGLMFDLSLEGSKITQVYR